MRDHVMGVRFVNGAGEVLHSGGRVLKNVTGLDLCKLLTGSHGTLGIITEVTLKVLPRPEATATLAITVADFTAGQRVLSAGLGAPYGVSGAAVVGNRALLRLEDFADSVTYRAEKLRQELAAFGAAEIIEGDASRALWRDVAEVTPLDVAPGDAVWRVSVKPTEGPRAAAALRTAFDAKLMLDWGGGLVWVAGPPTEAAHRAVMQAAGEGAFMLFRAPDALRAAVRVLKPDAPALALIARRVKAALDPKGLFNPGRMQAGF
jgi:glycolate oxidase FAD binding subunit